MKKVLRLHNLIRGILGGGKSLTALYNDIDTANLRAGTACKVSRHILYLLAYRPETVKLSYDNLVALDCYFSKLGEGLDKRPIFEQRTLLDCLATKQEATFLFAGKPRRRGQYDEVSLWDTKSIGVLIQDIYQVAPEMRFEQMDVMLNPHLGRSEIEKLAWYERIDQGKQSVISIGSPRACLASEVMLAKMFRVAPFEDPKPSFNPAKELPFYFLWPPQFSRGLHSHFAFRLADLKDTEPLLHARVSRKSFSAVCIESQWYPVERRAKECTMYGIIVAQRRSPYQVLMVISGISGPATYAAATFVKKIEKSVPVAGEQSPVLWVPVLVKVCRDPSKIGDDRVIDYISFLGEPRIWPVPPRTP
jgi:hypothetical protein